MSANLRFETSPAMWSVVPSREAGGGEMLRVGKRLVPLADVQGVRREEASERNVSGLLVMAGIFLVLCMVFFVGVFELGWRTRFLVGAVFLGVFAFVSLIEARRITPVRFVRLSILTRSGEIVFTTADPRDAAALEARIASEWRRSAAKG